MTFSILNMPNRVSRSFHNSNLPSDLRNRDNLPLQMSLSIWQMPFLDTGLNVKRERQGL
jgi:hypothetical protein